MPDADGNFKGIFVRRELPWKLPARCDVCDLELARGELTEVDVSADPGTTAIVLYCDGCLAEAGL